MVFYVWWLKKCFSHFYMCIQRKVNRGFAIKVTGLKILAIKYFILNILANVQKVR